MFAIIFLYSCSAQSIKTSETKNSIEDKQVEEDAWVAEIRNGVVLNLSDKKQLYDFKKLYKKITPPDMKLKSIQLELLLKGFPIDVYLSGKLPSLNIAINKVTIRKSSGVEAYYIDEDFISGPAKYPRGSGFSLYEEEIDSVNQIYNPIVINGCGYTFPINSMNYREDKIWLKKNEQGFLLPSRVSLRGDCKIQNVTFKSMTNLELDSNGDIILLQKYKDYFSDKLRSLERSDGDFYFSVLEDKDERRGYISRFLVLTSKKEISVFSLPNLSEESRFGLSMIKGKILMLIGEGMGESINERAYVFRNDQFVNVLNETWAEGEETDGGGMVAKANFYRSQLSSNEDGFAFEFSDTFHVNEVKEGSNVDCKESEYKIYHVQYLIESDKFVQDSERCETAIVVEEESVEHRVEESE